MASINRDEISRLELLHAAHPDGLVFPHLADAYRRAGRYSQAEHVLSDGLQRHADYSSAHVVLGRLRLDQQRYDEAENAFRRVLELDPHNPVALEQLGRVSLEQGRVEEALDQYRRLARLKKSPEVEERIRELETRVRNGGRGMPGEAPPPAASPEPAPLPEPRYPEPGEVVTETMAELYARQGLYERAAGVYRQLLERSPGDSRIRAKLESVEGHLRPRSEPGPEPGSLPAPTGPTGPDAPGPAGRSPPPVPADRRPPPTSAERRPSPAPPQPPMAPAPPDPEQRREPRGGGIRDHLSSLLSWQPSTPEAPRTPEASSTPASEAPTPENWEGQLSDGWSPEDSLQGEADPAEVPPGGPPEVLSPSEAEQAAWGLGEHWPPAAGSARSRVSVPDRSPTRREPAGRGAEGVEEMDWPPAMPEAAEPSERADGLSRSLIAITDMLVGLLEYRDPFFRGSSSLTRLVAASVADELGLSAREKVDLALAAVLRDLGRLAMGGRLVSTKSSHTPAGRRKIERHVDLALHLLEGIDLPAPVRLAVRHHHERWDGAGYPDGLIGEGIPRLARILAVVDSFAAMVSPRSYRLPRKIPDAARELREAAGSQYDPSVVAALMRVLARRDQPHLGFVQRPHILLVNPDQPGALVTAAKLCSAGYLAEVASGPAVARERLRRVPVAALVVSAENGEEETAAFVRELRVDDLFAALPVVVVDADRVAFRVRLLESGADVCFPTGTSYAELQGTLGALVRRTLQSAKGGSARGDGSAGRQEAPWLALQGDIEDFPLTWLLQVMKYDSRTAGIGLRTAAGEGAIFLRNGDAVHAQIQGGPQGEPALRRMLQWKKGRFNVQPDARPKETTIETSIMHLLLTQAVEEDHAAAGIFGAVSADT